VDNRALSGYGTAMRIAIASDHAAVELKAELVAWLIDEGHEVVDLGPEPGQSVDYPDYGYRLAEIIAEGAARFGVALCGSGIGISISVNRHPQVRCALVSEPLSAALAREHNDANCIALGARLIGIEMAKACVATFLDTEFADAGDPSGRHRRRVGKLGKPPFLPHHIETHQ
jgi:ribose 5-phosphate isomerase B